VSLTDARIMNQMSFVAAVLFLAVAAQAAAPDPGTNVFESSVPPVAESQLDQLIVAELTRADLHPALCSDAVFVRRAYLDVIGTLPTAREAREFIQDPNKKKQTRGLD